MIHGHLTPLPSLQESYLDIHAICTLSQRPGFKQDSSIILSLGPLHNY